MLIRDLRVANAQRERTSNKHIEKCRTMDRNLVPLKIECKQVRNCLWFYWLEKRFIICVKILLFANNFFIAEGDEKCCILYFDSICI